MCGNRLTTFFSKRSMVPCLFFRNDHQGRPLFATVEKDASDNVAAPDKDTLLEEPFCATDVPSSCQVKSKRRSSTHPPVVRRPRIRQRHGSHARSNEAQRLIPFDLFRDVRKQNSEYVREAHKILATCLAGGFQQTHGG